MDPTHPTESYRLQSGLEHSAGMRMIPVNSPVVSAVGYDGSTLVFRLRSGRTVEVRNVSERDMRDFLRTRPRRARPEGWGSQPNSPGGAPGVPAWRSIHSRATQGQRLTTSLAYVSQLIHR